MATKPIGSDPGKRGLMQGVFRGDLLAKLSDVPGEKAKSAVSRDVVKSDILDPVVKGKERRRLINETIIFWETYFKMLPKYEEEGMEKEEDCCDPCAQFPELGKGSRVKKVGIISAIVGALATAIALINEKLKKWITESPLGKFIKDWSPFFKGNPTSLPGAVPKDPPSVPPSGPPPVTTTRPPVMPSRGGRGMGSDFLTRRGKTIPISKADDIVGLKVGGPLADILRSLPTAVSRGDKETQELLLQLIAMGRQEAGLPRR